MKRVIQLAMTIVMIVSLTGCGKETGTSTPTGNQEELTTKENEEGNEKSNATTDDAEAVETVAEGNYPSDFVKCEGDSDFFAPVTEDYVIGIQDRPSEPVTEMICFDEKGDIVFDVSRIEYQDEEAAKYNAELRSTLVTSKEEFTQGTYILSGTEVYEYKTFTQDIRSGINYCDKMRYFEEAQSPDALMSLWFSIPYLTQEQLKIENYCAETDFAASGLLNPVTEDYYLEGDQEDGIERTVLRSYDENGIMVQLEEYFVYRSKEAATIAYESNIAWGDDYTRLDDTTLCYKHELSGTQADSLGKEHDYFEFEQLKDKAEADIENGGKLQWFSIHSLTEAQSKTYLELIAGIKQ